MTLPRRRITAARLIASPILLVIATAMVVQSARTLLRLADDADIRDLAASIEQGSQPGSDYLARSVERSSLDRASVDCGDANTRASLTVSLAALDAAVKQNNVTLSVAERNALGVAKHRLNCNPLDGNAWLRYAMTAARSSGQVSQAVEALRLSYWSAPSEFWVVEARLPFATGLYLAEVAGFDTEYLSDLRRFATYEPTNRVASAYVQLAPRVQALLHPLVDAQSDARKKMIVAEIDRLGVDFARQ